MRDGHDLAKYNGRLGVAVSFNHASGRYNVELEPTADETSAEPEPEHAEPEGTPSADECESNTPMDECGEDADECGEDAPECVECPPEADASMKPAAEVRVFAP